MTIKRLIITNLSLITLVVSGSSLYAPQIASAEPPAPQPVVMQENVPCSPLISTGSFLTFPTWYKYIKTGKTDVNGKCTIPDIQLTNTKGEFNGGGILLILLSIVDILLNLAGLVALGFIVYGGIRFVTSQGSSDGTKQARETVLNGIIGLVIATIAIATVTFLGDRLG